MTISGITQWIANNLGTSLNSYALCQIGAATLVAAVALPRIIKLATSCCSKLHSKQHTEQFYTWIVDGREVHFYLTKNGNIWLKVIRQSDKTEQFRSGDLVLPRAYENLPGFFKAESLKSELEISGWRADGAPNIDLSKGEKLHTWLLEDESISLISKGEHLFWKCEQESSCHWVKDVRPENLSKDDRISQLLTTHHPTKWNTQSNYPFIAEKNGGSRKWLFDNRSLSLGVRQPGEQPMWELVNHILKTTSWLPLNAEMLRDYSTEDRIARIECQDIDPSSAISNRKIENLLLVSKLQKPSRADPKVIVENDKWAVTLVDIGSCERPMSTWGGHAGILIEGIEENLPFTQLIDFMPIKKHQARVRIIEWPGSTEIPYSSKGQTFLRTKDKVKTMMAAIRAERDATASIPMAFNLRGIDAIQLSGNPAHNCFSWAREKLTLAGIESTPGLISLIATFPKQYTIFS